MMKLSYNFLHKIMRENIKSDGIMLKKSVLLENVIENKKLMIIYVKSFFQINYKET